MNNHFAAYRQNPLGFYFFYYGAQISCANNEWIRNEIIVVVWAFDICCGFPFALCDENVSFRGKWIKWLPVRVAEFIGKFSQSIALACFYGVSPNFAVNFQHILSDFRNILDQLCDLKPSPEIFHFPANRYLCCLKLSLWSMTLLCRRKYQVLLCSKSFIYCTALKSWRFSP